MASRGQLAVFMVVTIFLVVVVSVMLYSTSDQGRTARESIASSQASPQVKVYVESCLREMLDDSIELFGLQGGYIQQSPREHADLGGYPLHYGYYAGHDFLPLRQNAEMHQLAPYIEKMMPKCLKGFQAFEGTARVTPRGNPRVQVVVKDNEVTAVMEYPLLIERTGTTEQINTFVATSPVRLGHILGIADHLVRRQQENPAWGPVTPVRYEDVTLVTSPFGRLRSIYMLNDPKIKLNGVNYTFMFANLYLNNTPPDLGVIPNMSIKVGQKFTYQPHVIEWDSEPVRFELISRRIKIDPETGQIEFTPTSADIGKHTIDVFVKDSSGLETLREFELEVKP